MNANALASLKQQLARAARLDAVANYFMDHFGENDEFMRAGERVKDPEIAGLLQTILSAAAGPVTVEHLLVIHVASLGIKHGGFVVGTRIGNFFYIDDLRMGLCTLSDTASGQCMFARFSEEPPPGLPVPSMN